MNLQEALNKTKFCTYAHNAIHFTTDGKVGFCCLQDFRGFPTVADVDFDNLHNWYLNEPTLKKVRDDLRAGIEHPSCITCWTVHAPRLRHVRSQRLQTAPASQGSK